MSTRSEAERTEVRAYLEEQFEAHAGLIDKVTRQILLEMHSKGLVSVDNIFDELKSLADDEPNPNRPSLNPWDEAGRERVIELVKEHAASHLTKADIDDVFNLARKRSEAKALVDYASLIGISSNLLAEKVEEFSQIPEGTARVPKEEALGTRVALLRHFITENLKVLGVAKHFIRIRDLPPILSRSIGPPKGIGKIGGKATGIYVAHGVLCGKLRRHRDKSPLPIAIPESYHLRTDVLNDLMMRNHMMKLYDHKYDPPEKVRRDFPFIKELLVNAQWSEYLTRRLRKLLKQVGEHPLVVRSSSLLEDSFTAAFSGKYQSIFVANQGTLDQRLRQLKTAISEVYASTFAPDPIEYRKRRDLIDYDERMAILIQKVVGRRYGRYFFPLYAGVAFSRNDYRWSKRIKREDGFLRLVMGLGTHAVDRANDYPRMVAMTCPTLHPQVKPELIRRYSQRYVDVIDLEKQRFRSVPIRQVLREVQVPNLDLVVSSYDEGHLMTPVGSLIGKDTDNLVVTFDKLLSQGQFPQLIRDMLDRLEEGFQSPVDVEFACDGEKFYLLQCRPFTGRDETGDVDIPPGIKTDDIIFTANREVASAWVRDVEYLVYVDPRVYDALPRRDERIRLSRVVGLVNEKLQGKTFVLLGPGRWGSTDVNLGVPVSYADISNTRTLIEIAHEREGYVPEVSFGTHFFQDLVEAGIRYLPLYPSDPSVVYNERFLNESPNVLASLLGDDHGFAECLRVIHVPSVRPGALFQLAMDGRIDRAVGFLRPGR